MSQKPIPSQFKYAACAALVILGFGFTQGKSQQPAQETIYSTLYVEPCDVDYTSVNNVTCTAYATVNNKEYTVFIEAVDYTHLNDVYVDYVLKEYPGDYRIEKRIADELTAYFDDRRVQWIRGV